MPIAHRKTESNTLQGYVKPVIDSERGYHKHLPVCPLFGWIMPNEHLPVLPLSGLGSINIYLCTCCLPGKWRISIYLCARGLQCSCVRVYQKLLVCPLVIRIMAHRQFLVYLLVVRTMTHQHLPVCLLFARTHQNLLMYPLFTKRITHKPVMLFIAKIIIILSTFTCVSVVCKNNDRSIFTFVSVGCQIISNQHFPVFPLFVIIIYNQHLPDKCVRWFLN